MMATFIAGTVPCSKGLSEEQPYRPCRSQIQPTFAARRGDRDKTETGAVDGSGALPLPGAHNAARGLLCEAQSRSAPCASKPLALRAGDWSGLCCVLECYRRWASRSPGISQSSLDKRAAGTFDAKAARSAVRRRTVPGITDKEARCRSVGNTQERRPTRPTAAIR
jgi:hypothetical protein